MKIWDSFLYWIVFSNFVCRLRHLTFFIIRLCFGLSILLYTVPNLIYFADELHSFPELLRINGAYIGGEWMLILIIFLDVLGAVALMMGFLSRLFVLLLFLSMSFVFRIGFEAGMTGMEMNILYGLLCISIFLFGPGKISIDYLLVKRTKK